MTPLRDPQPRQPSSSGSILDEAFSALQTASRACADTASRIEAAAAQAATAASRARSLGLRRETAELDEAAARLVHDAARAAALHADLCAHVTAMQRIKAGNIPEARKPPAPPERTSRFALPMLAALFVAICLHTLVSVVASEFAGLTTVVVWLVTGVSVLGYLRRSQRRRRPVGLWLRVGAAYAAGAILGYAAPSVLTFAGLTVLAVLAVTLPVRLPGRRQRERAPSVSPRHAWPCRPPADR